MNVNEELMNDQEVAKTLKAIDVTYNQANRYIKNIKESVKGIQNAFNFYLYVTSNFSELKRDVAFDSLKDKLSTFCHKGSDLNRIICCLTDQQTRIFLEKTSINFLRKDRDYFDAFRHLPANKASILSEFLADNVSPKVLGEMLSEQPPDVVKAILQPLKKQLHGIFKSVEDIERVIPYFNERIVFFEEVIPALDLSTIVKTQQAFVDLFGIQKNSAKIAIELAKQAGAIFQKNYVSMRSFRDAVIKCSKTNTEFYDLMYLGMIQALPNILNYEVIDQNGTELIEYEVRYFVTCLRNASPQVQNKVWSALKGYLPTVITSSSERSYLIRCLGDGIPSLFRHVLSIFPESFDKSDLKYFAAEDKPMVSLIINLSVYKKERNRNSSDYYYFGLFKQFGACNKKEEFDAIDALITAILDPENCSLDPRHNAPLTQGGPYQIIELWAKEYSYNANDFLTSLQKPGCVLK